MIQFNFVEKDTSFYLYKYNLFSHRSEQMEIRMAIENTDMKVVMALSTPSSNGNREPNEIWLPVCFFLFPTFPFCFSTARRSIPERLISSSSCVSRGLAIQMTMFPVRHLLYCPRFVVQSFPPRFHRPQRRTVINFFRKHSHNHCNH